MKAPEKRRGKKKEWKRKKINLCSRNANTYGFENIPFVSDEKSYSLPDLLVLVVDEGMEAAGGLLTPKVATPLKVAVVPIV